MYNQSKGLPKLKKMYKLTLKFVNHGSGCANFVLINCISIPIPKRDTGIGQWKIIIPLLSLIFFVRRKWCRFYFICILPFNGGVTNIILNFTGRGVVGGFGWKVRLLWFEAIIETGKIVCKIEEIAALEKFFIIKYNFILDVLSLKPISLPLKPLCPYFKF